MFDYERFVQLPKTGGGGGGEAGDSFSFFILAFFFSFSFPLVGGGGGGGAGQMPVFLKGHHVPELNYSGNLETVI